MGVPFSWNIKSPSDPLSSNTRIIFRFGNLILLVLMHFFPVLHFGLSSGPDSRTATTDVTPHVLPCCGEFLFCSNLLDLFSSGIVLIGLVGQELVFVLLILFGTVANCPNSPVLPNPTLQELMESSLESSRLRLIFNL